MPTIKIKILLLIKEGIFLYLSDPLRQFKIGGPYKPQTIYKTVSRLEKDGLIKKIKKERKIHVRLTGKGKRFIRQHREKSRISSPAWDRKWRVVIFDIPEKRRNLRDCLRRYLKTLGYAQVQRSIWISPHNFSDLISNYVKKMNLSDYLFQITAENFPGYTEVQLAKKFWDIEKIHHKYLNLIEQYKNKKTQLTEINRDSLEKKEFLNKMVHEQLLWDYRSILHQDPLLPPDLLPPGWAGRKAEKFVASFLRSD